MTGEVEPDRLRALLTLMREFGVTKLVTPDGHNIERPPLTPLEAALGVTPAPGAAPADDRDDEEKAHDKELLEEADLLQEWRSHWQRLTLSSGAGIPPYPGPQKARAFIARLR